MITLSLCTLGDLLLVKAPGPIAGDNRLLLLFQQPSDSEVKPPTAPHGFVRSKHPPRLLHSLRLDLCDLKGADLSYSLREGTEAQALIQIDGTLSSISLGLNHQPYAPSF